MRFDLYSNDAERIVIRAPSASPYLYQMSSMSQLSLTWHVCLRAKKILIFNKTRTILNQSLPLIYMI